MSRQVAYGKTLSIDFNLVPLSFCYVAVCSSFPVKQQNFSLNDFLAIGKPYKVYFWHRIYNLIQCLAELSD